MIFFQRIIKNFIINFYKYKKIITLLVQAKLIDKLYWVESQPLNFLIPIELNILRLVILAYVEIGLTLFVVREYWLL